MGCRLTGKPLKVTAYRGSETGELFVDPERGVYFTTDRNYANDYGPMVAECQVSLDCPLIVSELEAQGTIELDRALLMAQGYDGRTIVYDDGSMDVIAFSLDSVTMVSIHDHASKGVGPCLK